MVLRRLFKHKRPLLGPQLPSHHGVGADTWPGLRNVTVLVLRTVDLLILSLLLLPPGPCCYCPCPAAP